MLAQRPEQDWTNSGVLTIRQLGGRQRVIPVRFQTLVTSSNWLSIYDAVAPDETANTERLTVIHSDGQPNQYLLAEPPSSSLTNAVPRKLTGHTAMVPFAGSDFWAADLGLEFLHWPQQRILKREMRRGQPCEVLESIDPDPAAGGYARVVSWLDSESPHGIIHADAYDAHGDVMKQFAPKKLKKIQGQYQLEAMEIGNEKAGTRTVIELNLK